MTEIKYPTAKELTNIQKGHLAWRLDHKTVCGYLTAGRIARGDCEPDTPINKIFEIFDMRPHQAKIHARKVMNFKL